MTVYTYRGDKLTDPALKGMTCTAVRRVDSKCVRGKNGNMLVTCRECGGKGWTADPSFQ